MRIAQNYIARIQTLERRYRGSLSKAQLYKSDNRRIRVSALHDGGFYKNALFPVQK
jgi:hypothetical protein